MCIRDRKVIEHKKAQVLEVNEYYQYDKYEKMKMSINDLTPEKLEKGIYKKYSFLKDQVEVSETTNKLILPISVQETASQTIYRKNPENKKTIIKGKNSNGIEEFFSTGDMLGTVLKDVFADINIYDDDIRLLQQRFVSPIGNNAISFYKYYLMDTLMVNRRECVPVSYTHLDVYKRQQRGSIPLLLLLISLFVCVILIYTKSFNSCCKR